MNQGILWAIIAVLVLIILGGIAWNVSRPPVAETPSLEPTLQVLTPSPEPTFSAAPLTPTASVRVSAQQPGRTVTIDEAVLPQNGFIAIHTDANGQPGPVIGNSDLLTAGTHVNTDIKLTRAARKGETLYAMLHNDADADGTYTFPGPDVPTTDAAGNIVMAPFTIGTVAASPSPSPATGGASGATRASPTPAALY